MSWQTEAACASSDPELFAPVHGLESVQERNERIATARLVCAGCPVVAECFLDGRRGAESGVWGGVLLAHGLTVPTATPTPKPGRGRTLAPCGTTAAWKRHQRRKEPACPACREAHTNAERSRQMRRGAA